MWKDHCCFFLFLFQGFGGETLDWDLHWLRHKNTLDKPGHEVPVHIARNKGHGSLPLLHHKPLGGCSHPALLVLLTTCKWLLKSLPWAHKLRRAVASLLLFPFSKVFLPGFEFLFFNLHTSQPLYTLHPPFAKAAWPLLQRSPCGQSICSLCKRLAW